MKKTRNIRKYLAGTKVKGYMENPAENLEANRINVAKAQYESESNPLFMGMDVIGNLAMEYGMSKAAAGVAQEDGKGGTGSKFWDKGIQGGMIKTAMQGLQFLKTGGEVQDGVTIETEGGEAYQTPDGQLGQWSDDAPSHEQGGIINKKPEGTMIYSDALKVEGKSMADRKMARERRLMAITKKLEGNPTDAILKSTHQRMSEVNQFEEQGDIQLQEFADAMQGLKEYAMGTSRQGVKKHKYDPMVEGYPETEEKEASTKMPWTTGDVFGMAGTAISTIGPYLQTLKNRAGDTVNKNFFEGFGEDALEANQDAMNFLGAQQGRALGDAESARISTMKRNQNNARGMNTINAMNFGADASYNKAIGGIYDDFSKQTMGLFSQKAQLENVQDERVMTGEQSADMENRMQRDNYDTQLSQNTANMGQGLQKFAGDLNKHKANQDFLSMLPSLSEWGLGWAYEGDKMVIKEIGKKK